MKKEHWSWLGPGVYRDKDLFPAKIRQRFLISNHRGEELERNVEKLSYWGCTQSSTLDPDSSGRNLRALWGEVGREDDLQSQVKGGEGEKGGERLIHPPSS